MYLVPRCARFNFRPVRDKEKERDTTELGFIKANIFENVITHNSKGSISSAGASAGY